MDIRTLEYMEERVKQAREIMEAINNREYYLKIVKGDSFKCLKIDWASNTSELTKWGSKRVENDYLAEVEAHMMNVFIDITEADIKHLRQKLDEL